MAIIRLEVLAPDRRHLQLALAGLTAMDIELVDGLPPLYEAGVVYRPEKPDTWSTADIVHQRGYGDCEDLAAWRAAELRRQGVMAKADVYRTRRPGGWHAIVLLPDGSIEDPSAMLGMMRYHRRRRA